MIPNITEHLEAQALDQAINAFIKQGGLIPERVQRAYTLNDQDQLLVQVLVHQKYDGPMVVFWAQPQWPDEDTSGEAWKK